ncbi:SDR family oxidoreductase [Nautilia lithotrophica]
MESKKLNKIYITSDGFVATHLKKAFKKNLTDDIKNADIIINTIGILREDKYSFEESHIEIVKNLIPLCNNKKLIHISALGSKLNHPSKYKHTKALAEKLIEENLKNYAIIKPSIILGDGQKLYEDLKKFKNLPVILAPKMIVSPLHIQELINKIQEIIINDLKGEFEICGNKMKMKDLFKEVFHSFKKNPIILEMPKTFFGIFLPIFSLLGIMTKDEYLMIEDNICKEENERKI